MTISRVLDGMAAAGVDVLVLGRPANVAYVTQARTLWTAGTRAFGPGAVVTRSGEVHLLSVWDDGVPASIPHSHLYGLSWNPATLAACVSAVPGVGPDAVVGVDAMTPLFASLLPGRLVDASRLMWAARRVKSDGEIALVRAACAAAEAGLSAVIETWRRAPELSPAALMGVFDEHIAALGVTTPGRDVVRATSVGTVLDAAVLRAGYEGGLGRTAGAAGAAGAGPWRDAVDRLIDACRPGASGADLVAAWTSAGVPLPPPDTPLVYGLGRGVEPPVIGAAVGADEVLETGMVLAVQGVVDDYFGRETVLVGPDGPEVLTVFPVRL